MFVIVEMNKKMIQYLIMIKRYSRPKMVSIWTLEYKFNKWLEIELAACKAHVELGNIDKEDYNHIKKTAKVC